MIMLSLNQQKALIYSGQFCGDHQGRSMLSCEDLKSTEKLVDMEQLLGIVHQRDFSKISAAVPMEVTLQRFFPEIPEKTLNKIVEQSGQLINTKQPVAHHQRQEFFYVKLSLAIAMTVSGLYFGGPLAATGAKAVVTQVYTILFGIPQSSCLAYHLILLPCQKYANALALAYGPYVMGLTAGPATYSGLSLAEYLGQKIDSLRKWAFASSITLDATPSFSAASVDEILEEFTELVLSENESDSDDDFVLLCPGFTAYQHQQSAGETSDRSTDAMKTMKYK